ncbi:hypothetical protein [Pseudomonas sp. 2822-17]|uniref:hypothetical protein n=1 Tax=Pseudomonas sp. 2822-17 TaxID=1712678 RepID=UPI00117A7CF4|nr:hypothetical protein [Pseudomonas sp. 2822-17]
MNSNYEVKRDKSGKITAVLPRTNGSNGAISALGIVVTYLSVLAFTYGILSFNRPDIIEKAFANKDALIALLFGAGAVLISFTVQLARLGSATFSRVSNPESRIMTGSALLATSKWFWGAGTTDPESLKREGGGEKESVVESKEDFFSYGAVSNSESFESYCSSILKSLSAYATASENTANKLLDKGVAFMAGGLIFYVLVIVIWQIFANFTHPDSSVMYVGMAACSTTFIVVEFLAAWFFKQYRYYVEVSMACLRVRSGYDRYLLGYYALREFKGESDEKIREQITAILKEDVKWPTYKSGAANDFNYMVESMSTAHTTLEKMKDLFQPKKAKPESKEV